MHNESIKVIVKVIQKFELLVLFKKIISNMSNHAQQSFQFTHSNIKMLMPEYQIK